MGTNKEIERKWLIDPSKVIYDLSKVEPLCMEQSYISFSPTVRLRAVNDEKFILCVKSRPAPGSLTRDEFEISLSREDYEHLLTKTEGNIIRKKRYCIKNDEGHTLEFDIFEGDLQGLAYMEIEFSSEEEAISYPNPEWAIKDVSSDKRYKNAVLAQKGMPEIGM